MNAPIAAIQPDYRRWSAIAFGMTRMEVIELLGEPLATPHILNPDVYACYGYLQFPLLPLSRLYDFVLGFKEERVFSKGDPFAGRLSCDGLPTKPLVITPANNSVFDCYPPHGTHLLDMRWHPVSGVYPMHYELECGVLSNHGCNQTIDYEVCRQKIIMPYFISNRWAVGQRGCFRVRGVNKLGTGPWSDYRHFEIRVSACANFEEAHT